jgi:hypothetical protein
MTNASDKNKQALAQLTGSNELFNRLQTKRIGIWSGEIKTNSDILLAEALAELLGRLWRNMDANGSLSQNFVTIAKDAAHSGEVECDVYERWNPPYDYVISLGTKLPSDVKNGIVISASGWNASVGNNIISDENPNPVGPFAAASFGAAEVFKAFFSDTNLAEYITAIPQDYKYSTCYGGINPISEKSELYFDNVHVFGVGAVSHSMLWILNHWPGSLTGSLHLIDPDKYDSGNGQRYIGMRHDDINHNKAEAMASKLAKHHPQLKIDAHPIDLNNYFTTKKPDCNIGLAICGLDSPQGRQELALKLPRRIVNMWTDSIHIGSSSFGFENDWPCLFCAYPVNKEQTMDETARIYKMTELSPSRIRHLLSSSEGITQEDALIISRKLPIDIGAFVGKPLRSVMGQICATTTMNIQNSSNVQVPLVFASGLAGLGGFIETTRELLQINSKPGKWQISVLRYPTENSWLPRVRSENCYLCSDQSLQEIILKKYTN